MFRSGLIINDGKPCFQKLVGRNSLVSASGRMSPNNGIERRPQTTRGAIRGGVNQVLRLIVVVCPNVSKICFSCVTYVSCIAEGILLDRLQRGKQNQGTNVRWQLSRGQHAPPTLTLPSARSLRLRSGSSTRQAPLKGGMWFECVKAR